MPLAVTIRGGAVSWRDGVGWRRWTAIGRGSAGLMLVIQPGDGGVPIRRRLVLVTRVLGMSMRDLAARAIPAGW